VPVGGGAVFSGESVVVTQPSAGEFKCFSSVCTHAGCTVAAGPTLDCPCHGSRFSITDGSVLQGPATSPLPEKRISVKAGQIYLES
jgi:Rieske Fe-S protein